MLIKVILLQWGRRVRGVDSEQGVLRAQEHCGSYKPCYDMKKFGETAWKMKAFVYKEGMPAFSAQANANI